MADNTDTGPLKNVGTGRPYMNSSQFSAAPQYQQVVQQKQYEEIEAAQGRIAPPVWAQRLHSQTNAWLANAGTGAKRAEGVYTSPRLQLGPLQSTKAKDAVVKEVKPESPAAADARWAQQIGTSPQSQQPVGYGATRMSEQTPPGAGEWVKGSAQNAKTTEYTPGSAQYLAPKDRFTGPPAPFPRSLSGQSGPPSNEYTPGSAQNARTRAFTPGSAQRTNDPFIGPSSPYPRKLG